MMLEIVVNTIGVALGIVVLIVAFLWLNRISNQHTSARGFAETWLMGRDQHINDDREKLRRCRR